eukprot:Gb_18096 [translate_table: standard]
MAELEYMKTLGSSKDKQNSELEGHSGKPKFRIVEDDTKPVLRDPLLRADPIETEQSVLRLPPFYPNVERYSRHMDISSEFD